MKVAGRRGAVGQKDDVPPVGIDLLHRQERLDEGRRQRPIGADLRVGHQTRQFVGRRPAAVRAAVADFAQVFLGGPIVGQKRAESGIHGDGDTDNGQRNQKELNSKGGRGDQWVTSRGFALDEFVHEWDSKRVPSTARVGASFTTCGV